jgi:hypothetical protein
MTEQQSTSHIKGWHVDLSDSDLEAAQKAVEAILGKQEGQIYYLEVTAKENNSIFGERNFYLLSGTNEPEVKVAEIDMWGNLVINHEFLANIWWV